MCDLGEKHFVSVFLSNNDKTIQWFYDAPVNIENRKKFQTAKSTKRFRNHGSMIRLKVVDLQQHEYVTNILFLETNTNQLERAGK